MRMSRAHPGSAVGHSTRAPFARRARSGQGVTIIEATIVLTVASILVAFAVPAASRSLDSARLTRAMTDEDAIATAVNNFVTEFTAFTPFTASGLSGGTVVQMLISDGDTPTQLTGAGSASWQTAVNGSTVDFLERHLVTNTPGGTGAYATGTTGWRGAYINAPLDPDPWGNRYAVNVLYLKSTTTNDVFVYSAGPNETIQTEFTKDGVVPRDDDLTSVVRRDAGVTVP
jgi:type II secretory pathway pseudopilin PulG